MCKAGFAGDDAPRAVSIISNFLFHSSLYIKDFTLVLQNKMYNTMILIWFQRSKWNVIFILFYLIFDRFVF